MPERKLAGFREWPVHFARKVIRAEGVEYVLSRERERGIGVHSLCTIAPIRRSWCWTYSRCAG